MFLRLLTCLRNELVDTHVVALDHNSELGFAFEPKIKSLGRERHTWGIVGVSGITRMRLLKEEG